MQEKYKKRKARKYIHTVTLRRPTARMICEAYFGKVREYHAEYHVAAHLLLLLIYCFCLLKNWVMAVCLGSAAALAFLPAPKLL